MGNVSSKHMKDVVVSRPCSYTNQCDHTVACLCTSTALPDRSMVERVSGHSEWNPARRIISRLLGKRVAGYTMQEGQCFVDHLFEVAHHRMECVCLVIAYSPGSGVTVPLPGE